MGEFRTWDGFIPYLGWVSSVLGMGEFRTWDGLFGVQKIIVLDKIIEGY